MVNHLAVTTAEQRKNKIFRALAKMQKLSTLLTIMDGKFTSQHEPFQNLYHELFSVISNPPNFSAKLICKTKIGYN